MPVVGVECMLDNHLAPFDECINKHECFEVNCPALTFAIKLMRDNLKSRADAGISMSTLISCPRAYALMELYDYYEPIAQGWIKSFGTITHSMIESDTDDMPDTIRERRLRKCIIVDGEECYLTGKPDEYNVKYKVLIDYKTKNDLPSKADPSHEFQFNGYAYLLDGGTFMDTGEISHNKVERGGMMYITRKSVNPFKKIGYPVWPTERIEAELSKRFRPILEYKKTGTLPSCSPFAVYGNPLTWKCDCFKIEKQLNIRGIQVGETKEARESLTNQE